MSMWIKTNRDELKRLKDPKLDSPITLSGNGTAQVSEEDGEYVIEKYDSFEAFATLNESDGEAPADDESEQGGAHDSSGEVTGEWSPRHEAPRGAARGEQHDNETSDTN